MHLPPPISRLAVLGSATLLLVGELSAQSVSSDDPERRDEPVNLSPFEVSAEADVGYVATNSLAGSRLNTPLKDTAASISVMTMEFLDDIAAVDLEDAMAYANNVQPDMNDNTSAGGSPNDNSTFEFFTNFRVRGIKATVTRNYFPWRMPNDSYNIERIEEQRGPNSILFGVGSAGGIINSMTKKAKLGRDLIDGSVTVGSYNSYRGTIDINQSVLDDRFALRLNSVYSEADGYREHTGHETFRNHLALAWRPFDNTTVRVEYEKGYKDQVVARTINILDGFSDWVAAGMPTDPSAPSVYRNSGSRQIYDTTSGAVYDRNRTYYSNTVNGRNDSIIDPEYASETINTGGPSQLRTGDFETLSAFIEQRIGENTYLELAYNHQEADQVSNVLAIGASDGATLKADLNETLPNGDANPNFKRLYIEGQYGRMVSESESDNIRLSASTRFDFGAWGDYRIAAMAEYEDRYFFQQQQRESFLKDSANGPTSAFGSANNPANGGTRVYRRAYVTPGDWASYYIPGPSITGLLPARDIDGTQVYTGWVNQNLATDTPEIQKTALLGVQAHYLDNRLVLGLGIRKDELDFTTYPEIRSSEPVRVDGSPGVYREKIGDYSDPQDYNYSGVTKTLGAVGHVTKNVSLFYNYSTNFSLPNSNIRILPDSGPADSPEGQGTDMGFMVDIIDGKLSARVAYFVTDVVNGHDYRFGGSDNNPTVYTDAALNALVESEQLDSATADSLRITTNGATFTRRVEGYELNLTANPTRNWRLSANYSITDGFETDIAPEVAQWFEEFQTFLGSYDTTVLTERNDGMATIDDIVEEFRYELQDSTGLDGRALPGNRRHKASFFTRYTFHEGTLKGLFVGGGYRYYSKLVAGVGGNDEIQYGNSYGEGEGLIGYDFGKIWVFKKLQVQLNVKNLFDDTDPIVTRFRDDGSPWRWKIREPRSYRLTARFSF